MVLFKFTDALAGAMTAAFVIDLGFSRIDYANIIKGVGFAATLIGGFAGGYVARAFPMVTSLWIGGILQAAANFAFSGQAMIGKDIAMALLRHHGRELHQCDRHSDLRRLPLLALQESAAYRDAVRAAHRALGGRPHLSVGGRGLYREWTSWAWFFAICAFAGIPGLVLLAWLQARGHFENPKHRPLPDRGRERALVEIVELAADRHAVRQPRHLDVESCNWSVM